MSNLSKTILRAKFVQNYFSHTVHLSDVYQLLGQEHCHLIHVCLCLPVCVCE